jgi:hypothetical protein
VRPDPPRAARSRSTLRCGTSLGLLLATTIALAACGGGGGTGDDDDQPDAPAGADAAPDAAGGCPRTPAPADRERRVVIGRPYTAGGMPASTWEVLDLAADGTLTRPDPRRIFEMGRTTVTSGTMAFTPDGEIGIVAQDDGTLGVFSLAPDGTPMTIHARFDGGFYASRVVIDESGDRAWVVDVNTRENGGGIYGVAINCDGSLTATGLIAPARSPGGVTIIGDHALVAARDVVDSQAGDDVHVITWGGTPVAVTGADVFPDDMQIIGGTALTADGGTYLVGDVSGFSSVPNRVAVASVTGTTLAFEAVLAPIEDPEAIAVSPFGDVAVVASALGDALVVVDAGAPGGAWRVRGEVAYAGGSPQLPGDFAAIDRGTLRGRVLVSENVSIRQLAFRANGDVDDLGSLGFGSGLDQVTGAIGVTP